MLTKANNFAKKLDFNLRAFGLKPLRSWLKADRVGLETALPPVFGKENGYEKIFCVICFIVRFITPRL